MRAVVQRVNEASVEVEGQGVTGRIGQGLCVLACVMSGDGPEDVQWIASKIARLRIFPDHQGRFDRPVSEVGGQVLLISQFTLAGDSRKGNRPSFVRAESPEIAEPMIRQLAEELRIQHGLEVQTGCFGADMAVSLQNDGPVTLILESPEP